MELSCVTRSEEQTVELGRTLARVVRAGDVVTVDGELGAGKTRFVRGFATELGVDPTVIASPTYVIVHQYEMGEDKRTETTLASGSVRTLHHVDAYRLHGDDELDSLGWDRVMEPEESAVIIEWSKRIDGTIEGLGAQRVARVEIERVEDYTDRRRVRLSVPDAWLLRGDTGAVEKRAKARPRDGSAEGLVDAFVRLGALLPMGWARCPTTGHAVAPGNPTFPFVNEQARMADLNKWFTGSYQVSRELTEEDLDDPDLRGEKRRE